MRMKGFLIVLIVALIPLSAFATLVPLSNCAQLKKPKTVLVVHASWCPTCQEFMPFYTDLSNDPKYKAWIFYEKTDDDWSSVCKVKILNVPHVFVKNMKELSGGDDVEVLKKYLTNH